MEDSFIISDQKDFHVLFASELLLKGIIILKGMKTEKISFKKF